MKRAELYLGRIRTEFRSMEHKIEQQQGTIERQARLIQALNHKIERQDNDRFITQKTS